MFPFRKLGLMFLILSLILVIALPALVVAQDDPLSTNTAISITTPEPSATAVGADQPTPVATVEPTAPPDNNPAPTPSDENNPTDNVILMWILTVGSYLAWCASLAVSVSVSVELIKPKTIEPFKSKLSPEAYLTAIYGIRLILTIVGFFYMWGGVAAARHYLPGLPDFIPDAGVIISTILLITLGEEFTHSVIDRFKAFGDVAKILIAAKQAEIAVMKAQAKSIPWQSSSS